MCYKLSVLQNWIGNKNLLRFFILILVVSSVNHDCLCYRPVYLFRRVSHA